MKRLLLCILLSLGLAMQVFGSSFNLSGNWSAGVMGSKVNAQINQKGNVLSGVAFVYSPGGAKNTYHFSGSMAGTSVSVSHTSGHRFKGNVTPDGRLVGTLTTKNGYQVPVDASRTQ